MKHVLIFLKRGEGVGGGGGVYMCVNTIMNGEKHDNAGDDDSKLIVEVED